MGYHISRCKICNKKLHIRQKNNSFFISNRCTHIPDKLSKNNIGLPIYRLKNYIKDNPYYLFSLKK